MSADRTFCRRTSPSKLSMTARARIRSYRSSSCLVNRQRSDRVYLNSREGVECHMAMPTPPPVDKGNGLLAETGAQLSTALVQTPAGQRMVLTVRTSSATLSVFLQGNDAKTWGRQI